MMQLCHFPSPNPQKVTFALLELGLDCEKIPVDLAKGEQSQPVFLAVNPVGRVPVLVDGDLRLTESQAILADLGRKTGRHDAGHRQSGGPCRRWFPRYAPATPACSLRSSSFLTRRLHGQREIFDRPLRTFESCPSTRRGPVPTMRGDDRNPDRAAHPATPLPHSPSAGVLNAREVARRFQSGSRRSTARF
jgi:hypothetical protein